MSVRPKLAATGFALGALVASLCLGRRADAQTTPTPSAATLKFTDANAKDRAHPDNETKGPENINLKDCLSDDIFTFRFALTGVTGTTHLHVWSTKTTGTACNDSKNQTDQCHQVANPLLVSGLAAAIDVHIRDIVNNVVGPFSTPADESVCMGATEPTPLVLQFFLQEGANAGGTTVPYTVNFDLEGPPAPTSVHAGPGQNVLVLDWKAPDYSAQYIGRYYAYVARLDGMDGGAGGAGSDAGDGGTDGECAFAGLTPGMPPGEGVRLCGDTKGNSTNVECTGLTNGARYAVGVTTVDTFYNAGPLSGLTCASPEPVTGFFEAYRQNGGAGGGGYCTIGATRSRSAAFGIVLAALGFAVRRARRRAASVLRGAA